MVQSIATIYYKLNSKYINFFFSFTHSLHVSAPTGHPQVKHTISYYFEGQFLLQRIRCTYVVWSYIWRCFCRRQSVCSGFSTYNPNTRYHINIKLVKVHVNSGVSYLAIFTWYILLLLYLSELDFFDCKWFCIIFF
jgi:hypothetical protein